MRDHAGIVRNNINDRSVPHRYHPGRVFAAQQDEGQLPGMQQKQHMSVPTSGKGPTMREGVIPRTPTWSLQPNFPKFLSLKDLARVTGLGLAVPVMHRGLLRCYRICSVG